MALRQWSSEIYTAEFRELQAANFFFLQFLSSIIQAFFIKSFVIIIFLQASTFCCSRDGRLGLLAG